MKKFWQGARLVLEIVGAVALVWGGGILFLEPVTFSGEAFQQSNG